MAMVGVANDSLQADSRPKSTWSESWQPTGAKLHSSDEPSKLSKWLSHDDSTINIVLSISIIIIIVPDEDWAVILCVWKGNSWPRPDGTAGFATRQKSHNYLEKRISYNKVE